MAETASIIRWQAQRHQLRLLARILFVRPWKDIIAIPGLIEGPASRDGCRQRIRKLAARCGSLSNWVFSVGFGFFAFGFFAFGFFETFLGVLGNRAISEDSLSLLIPSHQNFPFNGSSIASIPTDLESPIENTYGNTISVPQAGIVH